MARLTATAICELLAERHKNAVFVGECKAGSSWDGCPRPDAWVLLKTWSPLTTIGYEVKVARGDWLRDRKWPGYLALCHQLYFVSPRDIVRPEELPQDVGLIWTTKNGERLVTKRKAAHREIELPAKLMAYVLMSRTRIVRNMHEAADDANKLAVWQQFVEDRRYRKVLGQLVRGRIAQEYNGMHRELVEARSRMQGYDALRAWLSEHGFDPDLPHGTWPVRNKLNQALSDAVVNELRRVSGECEKLALRLQGESVESAA